MTTTNKYANGRIYKLVNDVDDKLYIGSTTLPLNTRFSLHKYDAGRFGNRPVYAHFNAIGWDHVRIEELERFPCGSNIELNARERYWYDQCNPMLNAQRPQVSSDEHIEENRERSRVYRNINLEKERERVRVGNAKPWTCTVCNFTCGQGHKSRHLQSKAHLAHFLENTLILTEAESDASSQASTSSNNT